MTFFFSSRRRHTRYWRDWSSDVCSSDLDRHFGRLRWRIRRTLREHPNPVRSGISGVFQFAALVRNVPDIAIPAVDLRSEERRVGKECRSRWWRYHLEKDNK